MSWAATRARGIPKKTKEISPSGVSSTEARYVVHRSGPVLHRSAAGLWSQRTVTVSPTVERPGAEARRCSTATQTLAGAAQGLEPRGRRGDAVLRQVDGAAAFDPLDDREARRRRSATSWSTQPSSSNGSVVSTIRLVRSRRRSASTPSSRRAPLEGGGADQGDRARVEVRRPVLEAAPDRVAEAARTAPRRAPSSPAAHWSLPWASSRTTRTVPSDAVAAPYQNTWSRRRNRLLSLPDANRPSPSTTAYARSPTSPRASRSTWSSASPPIDFTG